MHSRLMTATAAAALTVGFGLAGAPAWADQYADSVVSATNVSADPCCDDPADALGAPDATATPSFAGFVSILDTGTLTLDYDDNLCFEDGTLDPDLVVHEFLGTSGDEPFTVAVGLQGGALSSPVSGSDASEQLDFSGVASGAMFNQAQLTSQNSFGSVQGTDVDAMECLFTLDQAHIAKNFADNPLDVAPPGTGVADEIYAGISQQQFKAFTIDITNNTGIDNAFTGLFFLDTVPAEFDASGDSEAADVAGDDPPDNDGIAVISEVETGDCTASIIEHQSNGGPNGNKLKPEFISITADGLSDGQSCTIKVWVQTDSDHPGRGRSPDYTPTSCPVTLNDGVRVIDSSGNTLLEDDDSLVFDDNDPVEEGVCTEL